MSTKTFDSQTARFLATVATCMPPLSSDVMQGWIDNPKALKKTLGALSPVAASDPVLVETKPLEPVSQTTVPERTEPFNLAEFYRDRNGLVVEEDLVDRIGRSVCQTVGPTPGHGFLGMTIKEAVHYLGIREKLPEPSTLEDIAFLINAQWGGRPGFLRTDGSENKAVVRFNSDVFFVDILWMSCGNEWFVCEYELAEGDNCLANSQFICPGNLPVGKAGAAL